MSKQKENTDLLFFLLLFFSYVDGGFVILIEPFDSRTPHAPDPMLRLVCVDASIAMAPVFKKYDHVIVTSGTLSPIDFYPKILSFDPKSASNFGHDSFSRMHTAHNCYQR